MRMSRRVGIYSQGTSSGPPPAGTVLLDLSVQTVVYLDITPFVVLKHNYENSGATIVQSVYLDGTRVRFNPSGVGNTYAGSALDARIQEIAQTFSSSVLGSLQTVNIPSNGATIARSAFALSATELGSTLTGHLVEGTAINPPFDGTNAPRVKFVEGATAAAIWWTRSKWSASTVNVIRCAANGGVAAITSVNENYLSFAITLNPSSKVTDNGDGTYTFVGL